MTQDKQEREVDDGMIVRAYITFLRGNGASGARAVAREDVQENLARVERRLSAFASSGDPLTYIALVQERIALTQAAESLEKLPSRAELEKHFIGVAAAWSEENGITYPAWREIGVPAAVLKEAGIPRTRIVKGA